MDELKKSGIDKGAWAMRLTFLVGGLVVMWASLGYGLFQDGGLVGPGLMPFAAASVAVLASIVECVRAFKADQANKTSAPTEAASAEVKQSFWQRYQTVIKVFGVMLISVALTRLIGLLLGLSVMVMALLVVVERKKWWAALIAGVIAFLFGYLVFGKVLHVPLPTGMLGLV